MITENQLKADCTPEMIKKMVELAEGFEVDTDGVFYNGIILPNGTEVDFDIQQDELLFPLLIHRAVEGYNKQYPHKYVLNSIDNIVWFDGCIKDFVEIKNYSPSSLTHAECAMLHCLQEVIK